MVMRLPNVLTDEDGTRYLIVAIYARPEHSMSLPPDARLFGLVALPEGMNAMDLGRRFVWDPSPTNATRARLIDAQVC